MHVNLSQTSDPQGTKLISFETFSGLMASKINDKDSEADLIDAFRVFDKEGSGVISAQTLKYARYRCCRLVKCTKCTAF